MYLPRIQLAERTQSDHQLETTKNQIYLCWWSSPWPCPSRRWRGRNRTWKGKERLFQLDINSYIWANTATELAIEKDIEKHLKTFENVVPKHYHKFKDVFDKENFNELPPRRPWDHAIELLPGDHIVDCKTYNLTLNEQKELDAFLEENLKSGRICPFKSPFASSLSKRKTENYYRFRTIGN